MKLQYPKWMDKVPFVATFASGINENGDPKVSSTYKGLCCFSEKSSIRRDADGRLIQLSASFTTGCDIAPSLKVIEGSVLINGVTYKIYKSSRGRNPDGTVHHTRLELI